MVRTDVSEPPQKIFFFWSKPFFTDTHSVERLRVVAQPGVTNVTLGQRRTRTASSRLRCLLRCPTPIIFFIFLGRVLEYPNYEVLYLCSRCGRFGLDHTGLCWPAGDAALCGSGACMVAAKICVVVHVSSDPKITCRI